jgi:hypothetical protein
MRIAVSCCVTAALCLLGACSEERPPTDKPGSPPSETDSDLPRRLTLPPGADLLLEAGADGRPEQVGTGSFDLQVSTLDGGDLQRTDRAEPGGAWKYPDYVARGRYPRAVVVARPRTGAEALSPGVGQFAYGADVRLAPDSTGRVEDNGNNILQRGLASDETMFKLEIDANGRPGCSVKGRAGLATVLAANAVEPGIWYRIRCELRRDYVRVLVAEYLPSGATSMTGRAKPGRAGEVSFDGDEVPFSVGGKVARDGSVIKSETDQFNGEIANAYVRIP